MHRLVHSQSLDIRPTEYFAPLPWHAAGVEQGLEGDILGLAQRFDALEKRVDEIRKRLAIEY